MPTRFLLPRVALAALCFTALHAGAATVTVTSSADNTTVDGLCTLREAINAANAAAASADCPATGAAWGTNDTIAFSIGGSGVKIIQPTTAFPALTRKVTMDGYTQTGASANTIIAGSYPNVAALNTQIRIEIDGSSVPTPAPGLRFETVGATGSVVQGLSIVNFGGGGAAIRISAASAVQVGGNFLGWHADGTTRGVNSYGVTTAAAGSFLVGGSAVAAQRNLIAASVAGVYADTSGGGVEGNLIGLDRAGTQGGGFTAGAGVVLLDTNYVNVVDNAIANHSGDGLTLYGTRNTNVIGNTIGAGAGGVALGNKRGIVLTSSEEDGARSSLIYNNGITASSAEGILVAGSSNGYDSRGNRLDNNAIYGNGGLGINLQPDGEADDQVTPNDPLDADSGANGSQNFPVITSAKVNANGSVTVAFTLDSTPNTTFDISAYANPACHASGHGQGRHGTGYNNVPVSTNATGSASGSITVPAPLPTGWGAGAFVALLAHESVDGTSEFSACMQVAAANAGTPPVMGNVPDQSGTVGTAFSLNLAPYATPTDGDAISDWAYTGTLPSGLSFNNGQISGTPTQAGSFSVQVGAGDKDGWSNYAVVQLAIAAVAPVVAPTAAPALTSWGRLLAALTLTTLGLAALRRQRG